MKRTDQSGFTLIELLIVLAVIAVLTAILFPQFAQTRASARQASCLSNLHQIALANELYTQDYDETFLWNPPDPGMSGLVTAARMGRESGVQRPCADHPRDAWGMLLAPYLRSCAVLQCPSFPVEQAASAGLGPRGDFSRGYGLNAVLLADDCQPRSLASLQHSTSEVAIMGDSAVPWSGVWAEQAPSARWPGGRIAAISLQQLDQRPEALRPAVKVYWGWETSQALAPGWRPELHGGGSNFAFADGHAHFLRPAGPVVSFTPPSHFGSAASRPTAVEKAGAFPDALLE
jgi:prepilin-type N-terminal cleavage/methylation domain-containing protein/prepilin-type processing-associated H-X9-DG protein